MGEASSEIDLLGSEMLTWSDLDTWGGFHGPAAVGLVADLVRRPRRLLVVGPTTPTVLEALLPAADQVEVLVRSWPDAQEVHRRMGDVLHVHCGPVGRMARTGQVYDAVLALDGLDRLHSAEEPTPGWTAILAALSELTAPEGECLVAVDNPVGVDRLVAMAPFGREDDAMWPDGRALPPPPARVEEVLGRLTDEHGFDEVSSWACHGWRSSPRVLASHGAADRSADDPLVARLLSAAYAGTATPPVTVLRDAGSAAVELWQAGLGAASAPRTVLHLRRGSSAPADDPTPTLLVHETGDLDGAALLCRYQHLGGRWVRQLVSPSGGVHQVAPGLVRDLACLEGEVPAGVSVAAELRVLLAQFDVSSAGELLRRVREWITTTEGSASERVPVTLDRLLLVDGTLRLVDESYAATTEADPDTVLLRALLRTGLDLVGSGARHPWSEATTPRSLAASLAAAAGVVVDDHTYARAVALDAELRDPTTAAPDFEASVLALGGDRPMPYAELLELSRATVERLAMQDAHVVWLLEAVQLRQRRLRKLRRTVSQLRRSREYRVGRRILWVRDRVRRRRDGQEEGPSGVWRDRSEEPVPESGPVYVEQDLVPPGYQPHEGVVITPTGVDPGAEDD